MSDQKDRYVLVGHLPTDDQHYARDFAYGPFDSPKAAQLWLEAQPVALWPTMVLTLRAPLAQSWCRHCGDVGPAGSDHTCPCPNRDEECQQHPIPREPHLGGS